MKHLFIATALLSASLCANAAQPSINKADDSKYLITTGKTSLVVDAAQGGKVLSYKYEDQEIICQMKRPNAYGSTFWTSPQAEWNWPPVPEYDSKAYEAKIQDDALVLTGQLSDKYKYRILKEFKVDPADNAIVVTYTIVNESNATRSVAPWEITRVDAGGLIFFDAPVDEISPAGLMDFESQFGAVWFSYSEKNENRKINADGKGWLAFADKGLLLIKKFPDLARFAKPAPSEAEIQVYCNAGRTYTELESQGAYRQLTPGQSLSWTVRWYLVPAQSDGKPSQALLDTVLKIVAD